MTVPGENENLNRKTKGTRKGNMVAKPKTSKNSHDKKHKIRKPENWRDTNKINQDRSGIEIGGVMKLKKPENPLTYPGDERVTLKSSNLLLQQIVESAIFQPTQTAHLGSCLLKAL